MPSGVGDPAALHLEYREAGAGYREEEVDLGVLVVRPHVVRPDASTARSLVPSDTPGCGTLVDRQRVTVLLQRDVGAPTP